MSIGLSRERIIHTATAYIDAHGVEALTMRRIGAALGVEAMALYRYVGGRDELLAGVVDSLVEGLFENPDITREARTWEEYLQRVGRAARSLALAHPKVFPLIATRPPEAPWVRPPLRSVRWVDHFLSSLRAHGFSDRDAVQSYKAFTSFLLGHLLLECAERGAEISPAGAAEMDEASGDGEHLADFPAVRELEGLLRENHSDREFDDGLEDLIERLRHTDG